MFSDIAAIVKLVDSNNKFKLTKLYPFLSDCDELEFILKINSESEINLILTVVSMIKNANLEKVLKYIRLNNLKFRINSELIYNLVREKNHLLLLQMSEFAQTYLKQDLKSERIGEYYNKPKNETTLIRAIKTQNKDIVELIIDQMGASVDLTDSQLRKPIHIAAEMENALITRFLIDRGSLIDCKSSNEDTPLSRACQNRRIENVKVLIESGSDVNIKCYKGNAPIHISITDNVYHDFDEEPSTKVLNLLLKAGADITLVTDNGSTPIIRACGANNMLMVELFFARLYSEYKGTEYLQDQIVRSVVNAIYYLRTKPIKYLIRYVEDTETLNMKLKEMLDTNSPTSMINYHVKHNWDGKIKKFFKLFKVLLEYNINAFSSDPFFYLERYIYVLNGKVVEDTIISQEGQAYLSECLIELLRILITNGKINAYSLELSDVMIYFERLQIRIEDETIRHFKNQLDQLLSQTRQNYIKRQPDFLVFICRNVIRDSLVSLSDSHVEQLCLPNQLKNLILHT